MTHSSHPDRAALRRSAAAVLAAGALTLPNALSASDFTDFRIPRHSWTTASLSLDGWASRTKNTSEYETMRERSLTGALGGSLAWRLDSDPLAIGVSGGGRLNGQLRDGERDAVAFGRRHTDRDDRYASEYAYLDAFVRAHPASGPLGFELGVSAREQFDQQWEDATTTDLSPSTPPVDRRSETSSTRRHFDQDVSVYVTAGVGRVRDATGVHQAWLVEERLRETGALARPLSRRARRALAELHYVGGAYGVVYDRPQKRFWSDLVRLLQEDGAIAGELDAFSLFRLLEPAFARRPVFVRHTGFFVGPTLQAANQRHEARFDATNWVRHVQGPFVDEQYYEFHQSERQSVDVVRTGVRAQAHLPLAPQTQLDLQSSALLDTQKPQDFTTSSSLRLTHLIGERWSTEAYVSHGRILEALDDPNHRSFWEVSYGAELGYYLEDRWLVGLNVREYQRHEDAFAGDLGRQESRYRRDALISVSIRYHLFGILDTGGFLPTMRAGDTAAR